MNNLQQIIIIKLEYVCYKKYKNKKKIISKGTSGFEKLKNIIIFIQKRKNNKKINYKIKQEYILYLKTFINYYF